MYLLPAYRGASSGRETLYIAETGVRQLRRHTGAVQQRAHWEVTHHVEGALAGSLLGEHTQENRFNYQRRTADSFKEDEVSTKGQIKGAL